MYLSARASHFHPEDASTLRLLTMLLDRKFPHIIPIRVDREKLSCDQADLGRSQEAFCILFRFRPIADDPLNIIPTAKDHQRPAGSSNLHLRP